MTSDLIGFCKFCGEFFDPPGKCTTECVPCKLEKIGEFIKSMTKEPVKVPETATRRH